MDAVFKGLCRKMASEFGMNHSSVSIPECPFPDHSGFVWFASRIHCAVLRFIHLSTTLAQVEFSFISTINTFNFKKSYMLSLVPETSLTASKELPCTTALQTHSSFRSPVPSRLLPVPRWSKEQDTCF